MHRTAHTQQHRQYSCVPLPIAQAHVTQNSCRYLLEAARMLCDTLCVCVRVLRCTFETNQMLNCAIFAQSMNTVHFAAGRICYACVCVPLRSIVHNLKFILVFYRFGRHKTLQYLIDSPWKKKHICDNNK